MRQLQLERSLAHVQCKSMAALPTVYKESICIRWILLSSPCPAGLETIPLVLAPKCKQIFHLPSKV